MLRFGGWQDTYFGHVPFASGMEAVFMDKLKREGHDAVEKWLLEYSPFVYPFDRREHGDWHSGRSSARRMAPIVQWERVMLRDHMNTEVCEQTFSFFSGFTSAAGGGED